MVFVHLVSIDDCKKLKTGLYCNSRPVLLKQVSQVVITALWLCGGPEIFWATPPRSARPSPWLWRTLRSKSIQRLQEILSEMREFLFCSGQGGKTAQDEKTIASHSVDKKKGIE